MLRLFLFQLPLDRNLPLRLAGYAGGLNTGDSMKYTNRSLAGMLAAAILAMSLGACVSAGNKSLKEQTPESLSTLLQAGTPQEEVSAALGDPLSVSYTDSGREIWFYELVQGKMTAQSFIPVVSMFSSGVEGRKKLLVILYDKEELVDRYNLSDSAYESKTGILE